MDKNIENIVSDFQILGTNIKTLNLTNDFIYFQDNNEDIDRKVGINYEILDIHQSHDKLIGTLLFMIDLDITDKSREDHNQIHLSLEIEGGFYSSNLDQNVFKQMIGINGVASLFSIARSFILSVTSQAIPGSQIVIPMINVTKIKKSKNLKEER
jgi:preprotein translocase subunit SecB